MSCSSWWPVGKSVECQVLQNPLARKALMDNTSNIFWLATAQRQSNEEALSSLRAGSTLVFEDMG